MSKSVADLERLLAELQKEKPEYYAAMSEGARVALLAIREACEVLERAFGLVKS